MDVACAARATATASSPCTASSGSLHIAVQRLKDLKKGVLGRVVLSSTGF